MPEPASKLDVLKNSYETTKMQAETRTCEYKNIPGNTGTMAALVGSGETKAPARLCNPSLGIAADKAREEYEAEKGKSTRWYYLAGACALVLILAGGYWKFG